MFSQTYTSALAAAACTLFAAASASPDAFPFFNEPAHQLVNRADVIITTGATGGVHPRLEIGNLATRDDQWTLYIKTMSRWMQAGEGDESGFYGVASIHGVPLEDWNGAKQCDSCGQSTGYGTHDMIIFPCWHRIYLSHFEQKFLEAALEVAQSYPASSRERMLAAHSTLRLPYWDWAAEPERNSTCLPETITSPQITINGPEGQETLDNPLFKFDFTEAEAHANYYAVFTDWLSTYRYPASNDAATTSDNGAAETALNDMQGSLQDQVYQMLTACDDFMHFSNDQAGATAKCSNSLEQLHNTVHTLAGGAGTDGTSGGHLTYLPLSTYDPIFWLHHANVDRIFALRQTLHPESFVTSQAAPHATWVIPAGAQLNGDYPLSPFNKDASSYWTSNDVRDWTALGYTYPEFTTSNGDKSAISTYVNALYGNRPTLSASDVSAQVPLTQTNSSTPAKSPAATRGNNSTGHGLLGGLLGGPKYNLSLPSLLPKPSGTPAIGGGIGGGISSLLDKIMGSVEDLVDSFVDAATGNAYEYSCNIQTPRYALNGSYYVWVFNGAPTSEKPSQWTSDIHLVGMMGILSSPDSMPGHDMLVTGQIPLTRSLRSLVNVGNLLGMDEEKILPFLTKNLQWRISQNGIEIDVDSVPGFKAAVYSSQASVPKAPGELPSYSKYAPQVEVTKNKTGGAAKPIFGPAGNGDSNDSDESPIAPAYGSSSSSVIVTATETAVVTHTPSQGKPVISTETVVVSSSVPEAPVKTSTKTAVVTPSAPEAPVYPPSAPTYEASSSASVTGAYSYGSYAPSASPYPSLDTPSSYATAPASVIPSAFEPSATVSQPAETCPIIYTTVKEVETVYVTESTPSATAPAYAPPSPESPKTVPVAPYPVPSASSPAYYPTGTGSPVPTGTGKVYPVSPVGYTGAANALSAAGLFAGFGAIVAFFM